VVSADPVAGGDLNDAWRLELDDGTPAFAKTGQPGTYEAEAAGLAWLADGGAVVPEVLAASEEVLVLSWVEPARHDPEDLGRMVATMHRAGASDFGVLADGGRAALRLGPLEIPSDPAPDWPAFYAQSRIMPVARRAGLDAEGMDVIERLCGRMADLAGPPEPPARLHGDLWSGNVMDGPVLIDPAAYGGHREVDLAMLTLFGSPGDRFFAAYGEVHPLADGYAERVELWQLFPLLVHAALFGGSYGASAVRAARRYVG
jgi:fructosamine-3-kinase